MKRYLDLLCAYGGMIFAVLFGIGFLLIAHFVPPLDPHDTAEQTAKVFRDDKDEIRIGLLVCYLGCPFYLAFGAAINAQTRRIVGAPKAILQLQSSAFSASLILIIGPFMLWWVAAFRPGEIAPELTQLVNDIGWISFLVGWCPFVTWYVATGVAILCDDSSDPVYPRWSGYVALMTGLGQTTASFLVFFKTGPFAWDGLFSWWLPATEFFLFFVVMTVVTIRAINAQYAQGASVRAEPVSAA